ncbi:unnamed protein product [Gordionus sp. m RMFG-2023]
MVKVIAIVIHHIFKEYLLPITKISLFGTNNNDGTDDFITPQGRNMYQNKETSNKVLNMNRFIQSWEASSVYNRNDPQLSMVKNMWDCHHKRDSNERQYYTRNSPSNNAVYESFNRRIMRTFINSQYYSLRKCDDQYSRDTLEDIFNAAQRYNGPKGVCALSLALSQECHMKNIHIDIPEECVMCQAANRFYSFYEPFNMVDKIDGQVHKTVHVVYLVEEHKDISRIETYLLKIIKNLQDELMRKHGPSSDIKYTLVGFGNSHLTMRRYYAHRGKIVFNYDDLEKTWHDLKLSSETKSNQIDVIYTVSKEMNFVPNSLRIITLISTKSPSSIMRIKEKIVQLALKDQSVTLNTILKCPIISTSEKRLKTILGFDRDVAYTSDHINQDSITGDKDLLNKAETCEGALINIVKQSDGVIFNIEILLSGYETDMKALIKIMPKVMSQIPYPLCQTCICNKNANNMARFICSNCHNKNQFNYQRGASYEYPNFDESSPLLNNYMQQQNQNIQQNQNSQKYSQEYNNQRQYSQQNQQNLQQQQSASAS